MKRNFTEQDEEFKMFGDFWKMVQFFYEVEDNEIYWTKVIKASAKFLKMHNDDLASKLCKAYIDYLEEKYNKKKEGL